MTDSDRAAVVAVIQSVILGLGELKIELTDTVWVDTVVKPPVCGCIFRYHAVGQADLIKQLLTTVEELISTSGGPKCRIEYWGLST